MKRAPLRNRSKSNLIKSSSRSKRFSRINWPIVLSLFGAGAVNIVLIYAFLGNPLKYLINTPPINQIMKKESTSTFKFILKLMLLTFVTTWAILTIYFIYEYIWNHDNLLRSLEENH
jgi:hypothetical protein